MAVPANLAQNGVLPEDRPDWTAVQLRAAELFGQGFSIPTVAKRLNGHLLTEKQRRLPPKRQRQFAMRKLRYWQRQKSFRDLMWDHAVAHLDSRASAMANGIARRAEAGRVDAAKFGLELAGRYTPKGHDQPTAVQIVIGQVPRPQAEVVEGDVLAEEDG